MLINITNLDKILLLQTLYFHADPKGYGIKQYRQGLQKGRIVEGLPAKECEGIFNRNGQHDNGYLVDYFNGKPLKFGWTTTTSGQQLSHTLPYDAAHGRYRFFEALLNVFDPEEILITDKEYDSIQDKLFLEIQDKRIIEYKLANILQNAICFTDEKGVYWKINSEDTDYRSAFLSGLYI